MFLQDFLSEWLTRFDGFSGCSPMNVSSDILLRAPLVCVPVATFLASFKRKKMSANKQIKNNDTISTPWSLLLAYFPFKSIHMWETLVVYYLYLHGLTGWFMVWARSKTGLLHQISVPPPTPRGWRLTFSSYPWRLAKIAFTPEDFHKIWAYLWRIWVYPKDFRENYTSKEFHFFYTLPLKKSSILITYP